MTLINKIINRIYWFFKFGSKQIFCNSKIIGSKNSSVNIHKSAQINQSIIYLHEDSLLIIEEGTIIKNSNISIKGTVIIGKNNIIYGDKNNNKLSITVDGDLQIGNYNRIQSRILIRYGGKVTIGNHNNINHESELRSDEKISIGNFNQISYKVIIWDTNTHNIYPAQERRNLTIDKFPIFGYEYEKPKTKPVIIGDDCWIGREAALLKGSTLSNKCILGFRTVLSDFKTEESTTIVSQVSNKVLINKI